MAHPLFISAFSSLLLLEKTGTLLAPGDPPGTFSPSWPLQPLLRDVSLRFLLIHAHFSCYAMSFPVLCALGPAWSRIWQGDLSKVWAINQCSIPLLSEQPGQGSVGAGDGFSSPREAAGNEGAVLAGAGSPWVIDLRAFCPQGLSDLTTKCTKC